MKTPEPPHLIRGERVELRRHVLADAPAIYAAVDADRERLARWLPWVPKMRSVADEEEFVRFSDRAWDEGTHFGYTLVSAADGAFLGTAGAVRASAAHARVEIGYWIAAAQEGRGYVTDAVRALEAALFEAGFHRVEIRCDAENARSAGVPRRLGYRLEGRLRQDMRHPEPCPGAGFRDTLVFSKLEGEWRAERAPRAQAAAGISLRAARADDLDAINRIYTHAIENTTATFDTEPRTAAQRLAWFDAHGDRYPIRVAVGAAGEVVGWASLQPYSDRRAYAATAEIAVYVDPAQHGRGIGRALVAAVLKAGDASGIHAVLARITEGNEQSVRMHLSQGFVELGTLREAGMKFGRRLDVHLLQRLSPTA